MATFEHMGLVFDVPSPSFWSLHQRLCPKGKIEIFFEDPDWCLYVIEEDGHVQTKRFATRDEAIGFIIVSAEKYRVTL